jgi:hypothetical protein
MPCGKGYHDLPARQEVDTRFGLARVLSSAAEASACRITGLLPPIPREAELRDSRHNNSRVFITVRLPPNGGIKLQGGVCPRRN